MKENKSNIMWEYLRRYPALDSFLKFNANGEYPGETSFNTVPSEKWEKRYVRGKGVKQYDFTVVMIRPYDTGTSEVNINEIFNVALFMSWIEQQNMKKDFPDFGEGTRVLSIETNSEIPNLAATDPDGSAAKYMFGCRVRYEII